MKPSSYERSDRTKHRLLKITALLIAFLSLTLSLPAQEQPTLAVMPIYSMGVDKTRVSIVYDYIIDQVNRTHAFTLVERAAIDRALAEIKFSMKEIIDERTAAKIGKISGAKYILIPALYFAEGTFHLSLRVIETDTARIKNTAVKTTDSFKNVEGLAAQAALALLELDTTTAAPTVSVVAPASKKLWGNTYFVDDRDFGGSSTIDTGIAKDGVITLRGNMVPNPKGAFLVASVDLDEAGLKLMKKAKGIRFKAAGGNQYFGIDVKMKSVTDWAYHRKIVFIPDRETEIVVLFSDLVQWWGKKVAFNRDDIFGIQFATHSDKFNMGKVTLDAKDIAAVFDDEKPSLPEKRSLAGTVRSFDDNNFGGSSHVNTCYMEGGFAILEGRVTKVFPYGYIGMAIDFDDAGRKNIGKAKGVTFRIAGDGKECKFNMTTRSVKDGDFHCVLLKAEKEFRSVTVLFKDLKQEGWGKPTAFNRNDITGVELMSRGQPWASVQVMVADIEYIPE